MLAIGQYRLIIFDADGTLRRCLIPGQPCPNKPGEWELMPNVVETIRALDPYVDVGIASNQAGVAAGFLTYQMAENLLVDLYETVTGVSSVPDEMIQLCPHAVDDACICRKPQPGMLYALMHAADIYKRSEVLYVGDMDSNHEAAVRIGIDFAWAKEFFRWE